MNKFISNLINNKHIVYISFLNFVIIYTSSFTPGYGYFIDEFYYIACANNPAFGYVDHPPLAPILLALIQFLFGNSIYVIRIVPALALSVTIIFIALIVKEFGGNKTAQSVAAFGILASPIYAAFGGFYSMNAFEPLIAVVSFYLIILMIKENNPKKWLAIGLLFGLGLMNKHTAGIYIFLVVFGMLVTEQRKLLFNKWFLYSIVISFIIFLPNIIWQIQNGYPTIEFYKNITFYKNVPVTPVQFVINQILYFSPILFLFLVAGAIYFLFGKKLKQYRVFGIMFIIAFLFFMVTKSSRPDRLAFAYPIIVASGSFLLMNIADKYKIRWIYGLFYSLFFIWFLISVPLVLPYLSYEKTEQLVKFWGLDTEMEKGKKPRIPQLLADRIGWEEKADMVVKVFQSIPDEEKKNIIIAATNYGNAGAIELYGKKYNLPPVVTGHNNYYIWSKNRLKEKIILLQLGYKSSYEGLKKSFNLVDSTSAFFDNEFCSPHERDMTIFICKEPKIPPIDLLEKSKFFY